MKKVKISVILPCRNEEKTLKICIEKIKKALKNQNYEIIVSDSSTDKSPIIAKKQNTVLIKHNLNGYGNAILQGISKAKGDYIIIADADNTYDFLEIPKFIKELDAGFDFVIGSRLKGDIKKGAMPKLHQKIGTPTLNFLIKLFFKIKVSDCNSGFRAIKMSYLKKLNLKTTGMEFASEMIVKAAKYNLKIKEIPITYSKRLTPSKLNTWSDGYKHLRFLLLYSPNYVFFYPGILFIIFGILIMSLMLTNNLTLFNINFIIHPTFIGSLLTILGYQLILTGTFAKIYAHNHLNEKNKSLINLFKLLNLEKAIQAGSILILISFTIFLNILLIWIHNNFGELNTINLSIIALTFAAIGIQTISSGFFFSILGIKEN